MWIRPKRMNGKPGVWAKEVDGTWTVFSYAGILGTGLTSAQAKDLLDRAELVIAPHKKGTQWSLKNKQ